MRFEFATATRILFGVGTLKEAGPAAREMGRRAMVVAGLKLERVEPLFETLRQAGLSWTTYSVEGEPTIEVAQAAAAKAKGESCDVVIGFGGGSSLDTAKAAAAILTNPGDVLDYLEVIGKGKPLTSPSAPCITIPTTAGTGSEVTRNSVLGSSEKHVKVSLRSPLMLPRLALVDPQLTYGLPPQVTASTGLDALTQLIEPYVSNKANPMTDALCREGMSRASRSLRAAYERENDPAAREDMSLAALFGGLALANAGLGAAHGFAGPLGGLFPGPHGAICARLLPIVMDINIRALQNRQPDSPVLPRYTEIARILTGSPSARAEDGVHWVKSLCQDLNIPPLSSYGMSQEDIPTLVEMGYKSSSMKGNPLPLTNDEMAEILERAR